MTLELSPETFEVGAVRVKELIGNDKKACVNLLFNMVKIQRGRVAFPGSNPVSIERAAIAQLTAEPYWVAPKTDGQRMMVLAVTHKTHRLCLMVDRALRVFVVPGELPTFGFVGSLLDGELIRRTDGSWVFLVFDTTHLSGLPLGNHPFSVRMAFAGSWLRDVGKGPASMAMELKQFTPYGRPVAPSTDVCTDGLVFVPENEGYTAFRTDKLFKWKADGQHTVDFQVQGRKLMVLTRGKLVEKGKLHPDDRAAEGSIVECQMVAGGWRVVKARPDKTTPNDSFVHRKTVLNIEENIQRSEFLV